MPHIDACRRPGRFLAVLILVVTLSAASSPCRAGIFNPETFTLSNGMQVVVISNHRVPVVNHMVWYRVGAIDEPPGKSGIAHFLEHLMFKGTKTLKPGEFSTAVARNGGRENAFTGHDYTGYYQTIAVDRLETVMRMEADRMTNLVLNAKVIEPERNVILEERRQRTDNNPSAILREQVGATLFMNHPYRRPVIGWEHEIRALSVEDIIAFYRRWYAPNNAILVVAGDITAEQLKPLAEKYYGIIPAVDNGPRLHESEPPPKASRRVSLADERVRQPSWSRVYLAPSHGTGQGASADALEVLAEAIGGGATSRLYKALVIDRKLAVSAGASYSPDTLGPSRFGLHASPRPGVSLETLEQAMEEEVANILTEGVGAPDVERARTILLANAVYARDSLTAGPQTLGAALARGYSVDHVETWPDRIRAVTKDRVDAAARQVLSSDAAVTATLLPKGKGGKG